MLVLLLHVPDPDTERAMLLPAIIMYRMSLMHYLLVSYEETYIPFTNLITYMDRYVQICQGTDIHFHSKRRIDH